MKLKIYNETWEVKEVTSEEIQEVRKGYGLTDEAFHMGLCDGEQNTIYLLKRLAKPRKRSVLIHEVSHAINYIFLDDSDMTEEDAANYFSAHYDEIGKVVKEYFKPKKRRTRKKKEVAHEEISGTTGGSNPGDSLS